MNTEISIIVPVYNTEKKLKRCIESILNQSYQNFELILVDDGSTDDSGKICDKYAEENGKIIVIHQKNQGVSVARNTGIENASGTDIVFIDSDDFVDKDLLHRLVQPDADLVMVGFSDYFDNKVTKVITNENKTWNIFSEKGIIEFLNKKCSVFVWGKKYKKSVLDKYHIRFRVDMPFNEDIIFNNEYILKVQKVVNIEWAGYYHCQYSEQTLSSRAEQASFIELTKWKEIAFHQFVNYPSVQEIFISQMLYFTEKEFVVISNSRKPLLQMRNDIKNIVENHFFQQCVLLMPDKLSFDVRFYCKHKLILLLLAKYHKKHFGKKN